MKTIIKFKTPKTLSFSLIALAILTVVTCFTSCKINNNNVTPPAFVMAANAAQASAPQDFYVDNNKLNGSAIAYTQSTTYFNVTADNHQCQFKNSATATVNASFSAAFVPGGYYTAFYTDNNNTAAVYQDDRTMPQSSDARVRFINLSTYLNSSVDFSSNASGKATKIINSLAYQAASDYAEVAAASTFSLYAAGSSTVLLNIPVALQAGHIYTIFISGTTSATVTYTLVAEN